MWEDVCCPEELMDFDEQERLAAEQEAEDEKIAEGEIARERGKVAERTKETSS